jgi:thermopsin
MTAVSAKWGLAVFVTVVLLISTLGLAGWGSADRSSTGTSSPAAAFSTPAHSGLASTDPGATPAATQALLTSKQPTAPATSPTPSGRTATLVNQLQGEHVPLKDAFLPDLNANPHPTLLNGHISPTYDSAPAPLGVAEYGLRNASGTIEPYTLSTASVEGTYIPYAMNGLSQDISGPDEYGVQLNSVLNNVTLFGTTGYQFWTQNVIEYSVYSQQLFFVSNIWNFSGGAFNANTLYQHGPNGTVAAPELYYATGGPITIAYPFTLHLYLNSTLESGRDAVYFNFTLNNSAEYLAGSYDYAIFNSTVIGGPATIAPAYVANGFSYNAFGLPDDFEMTLGGPGGGSNFDTLESDAYFGLEYWNATTGAYETVPSAYGYGSETGETAIGADVLWGDEGSTIWGGIPSAFLATGPSFLQPLWNISGAPEVGAEYGGSFALDLSPSNAFVFLAQGNVFGGWGTATNWSLFQWTPYSYDQSGFELDPGTYTVVALLANYDPMETTFTLANNASFASATLGLTFDPDNGVYTPLWAFDNADAANISTAADGGHVLFNQQYGTLGNAANVDTVFPWFGLANDYLFPVFPGIYLDHVTLGVQILSPPSFKVAYPAANLPEINFYGLPTWNNLQLFFDNDTDVYLLDGANIGGWWWSNAYFGSVVSSYNVVFWNTSYSEVYQNTFNTGGNALYFYGGTDNLVANNTFEQSVPIAANPYGTVAAAYGSVGLFDADYGNATDIASFEGQANDTWECYSGFFLGFGYCDLIFNNIFLTEYTADSPLYDPYYFYPAYPTCPTWLATGTLQCYFDNAWNGAPVLGEFLEWNGNILGGPQLGGNYWWDYGSADNPYSYIPYDAYSAATEIIWGGDYLPLTPYTLYTVTFQESGLPVSTEWYVGADIDGVYQYWDSDTTTASLIVPSGSYSYYLGTFSADYAGSGGTFTVVNANVVMDVQFVPAYTITFDQTGLANGTEWWVYLYNATTDNYLGSVGSESTTAVAAGMLPGQYLWFAGADSAWFAADPETGTLSVSGNTTASIHFVALHQLTVTASGLGAGVSWTLLVWNASFTDSWSTTGANLSFADVPGSYNWAALASGYVGTPSQGTFALVSNETQTVVFGTPATLTFTETGLSAGAAWTVALTQFGSTTNFTGTGDSLVLSALAGAYSYTVSATGFTPSTATGSGTLPANDAVSVAFTASTGPAGTLSLTVAPSGATASVNGQVVSAPFSQSEAPGIYAIVVTESGYQTYYNNVSVTSDHTTTVAVTLVATSSSTGTSSTGGISATAWLLIAVLAVLAVIFVITTLLFSRRGRSPPTVTPPVPPPATGGAPPAAPPAWSEGPGPGSPPSPPPGAV